MVGALGGAESPLRAAVVGCGAIGAGHRDAHPDVGVSGHAVAYQAHPRTRLVAVCDTDPVRAGELARREGCEAFTDLDRMLARAAPEVVSVATPDATHAAVVARCLAAPSTRAVLAEKPLATTASAAVALRDLAAAERTLLSVNYTRRFAPAIAALPRVVAEMGGVQAVRGAYVKGLLHNGTHWLDLLRMVVGEPVAVRGRDRLREGGDDPTLDAELLLADGAPAQLSGLRSTGFTVFEMDLLLARGRIRVEESGHVVEVWGTGEDPRHRGYRVLGRSRREVGVLRDAALRAVDDVVQCLDLGRDPACGPEDGIAAVHLAELVRESAASGGQEIAC